MATNALPSFNPPVQIGSKNGVTTSKVYRYEFMPQHALRREHIAFWAQNGMVHLEDSRDGAIKALRPGKFFIHAMQVYLMQRKFEWDINERIKADRLINDAAACCKGARTQGDPFDDAVQEHRRKHRPKNKVRVLVDARGLPLGNVPTKVLKSTPTPLTLPN